MTAMGWCRRCGQPYEDATTPTCECAGDPPLVGAHVPGVEHLRYRNRVRSLRTSPSADEDAR